MVRSWAMAGAAAIVAATTKGAKNVREIRVIYLAPMFYWPPADQAAYCLFFCNRSAVAGQLRRGMTS